MSPSAPYELHESYQIQQFAVRPASNESIVSIISSAYVQALERYLQDDWRWQSFGYAQPGQKYDPQRLRAAAFISEPEC